MILLSLAHAPPPSVPLFLITLTHQQLFRYLLVVATKVEVVIVAMYTGSSNPVAVLFRLWLCTHECRRFKRLPIEVCHRSEMSPRPKGRLSSLGMLIIHKSAMLRNPTSLSNPKPRTCRWPAAAPTSCDSICHADRQC